MLSWSRQIHSLAASHKTMIPIRRRAKPSMSMGLSSRRQHPDLRSYDIAFMADNAGIWMDHCHNLTGGRPARLRHTRRFPQKLTPVAVPPCVSAFLAHLESRSEGVNHSGSGEECPRSAPGCFARRKAVGGRAPGANSRVREQVRITPRWALRS